MIFDNKDTIVFTGDSTTDAGKAFDFEKFVKSDDFQYLLHSITLAN